MTRQHTDVLVLGGGTMGTAAGWAVAQRGHSVRILEQFDHVHTMGSHSGITRIFRHAYAEGADYVPWALAADDDWHALQDRTGMSFIHRVGYLGMSAPGGSHAEESRAAAMEHDVQFEWLSGAEIRQRFPAWNVPDDWTACYTSQSGYIEVEPALRALARELRDAGGLLETHCRVSGWSADSHGVRIESSGDSFSADTLIVTGGAWNIHLLGSLGLPLDVRRKPVLWFRSDKPETILPDVFPCWFVDRGDAHVYGLPQVDVSGIKAGMHSGGDTSDPETVDRVVHDADVEAELGPFMRRYLHGVPGAVETSDMCLYTMTPDDAFILDRHPDHSNVVVGAGFSGHGFKFAPVIGKHLADLALERSVKARPMFSLSRFAASPVSRANKANRG